ncbi:hypothetical protein TNCV_912901 [Trichonephila clavipes]|nr:hypothetical protein TNCV_912901 [Trichonephila clavipes]
MVTAEECYEFITRRFLIDECWIKEFFSGYIVNSEIRSIHVTRHDAGRRSTLRNPSLEESVLNVADDRPESSTQEL